jgi:hypothetical protein
MELKDDIPLLIQNLIADQKSCSQQLTLTRAEAALHLWQGCLLAVLEHKTYWHVRNPRMDRHAALPRTRSVPRRVGQPSTSQTLCSQQVTLTRAEAAPHLWQGAAQ